MNEIQLIENKKARDSVIERTEVLDKVKFLPMLPDGIHTTIREVVEFYNVDKYAIQKIIYRRREELESDGLKVLKGNDYDEFNADNLSVLKISSRKITVFTRRAVLRIGMLLRDSEVAKQVRSYLLNVEEIAKEKAPEIIQEAVEKTLNERVDEIEEALNRIQNLPVSERLKQRAIDSEFKQFFGIVEVIEKPNAERRSFISVTEIAKILGIVTPNLMPNAKGVSAIITNLSIGKEDVVYNKTSEFEYKTYSKEVVRGVRDWIIENNSPCEVESKVSGIKYSLNYTINHVR